LQQPALDAKRAAQGTSLLIHSGSANDAACVSAL
jgi:hypothetical protein